jgi:hypothetical protein
LLARFFAGYPSKRFCQLVLLLNSGPNSVWTPVLYRASFQTFLSGGVFSENPLRKICAVVFLLVIHPNGSLGGGFPDKRSTQKRFSRQSAKRRLQRFVFADILLKTEPGSMFGPVFCGTTT